MKRRVPLFIFLFTYFIFTLLTFNSYGITNDEAEEYFLGKLLYIKLRANDPVLEKNFVIDDGRSRKLLVYNRLYPALHYSFNDSENYETNHLLNLLFASTIFIASYELILRKTKQRWLALAGPLFLLLTPRFLGHIPANPKDVPFAIAYFVSLTLIILLKKHDNPFSLLVLGFSFGITQSLRIVGYSIYPVYVLYVLSSKLNFLKYKKLFKLFSRTMVIFLIGFLIHMATLPYLGADPFSHFKDLFMTGIQFPWNGEMLFGSKLISADSLPWYYLPTWIVITTPVFILFLFFNSLSQIKSKASTARLLWIAIVTNLALFFLLKPRIYDGLRHFLFLLPIISSLAALSFLKIFNQKKKLIFLGVAINILLVAISIYKLFPYQYVYFNEFVGGTKGAANKYEVDYWGASYKEVVSWLNNNIDRNIEQKVFFCGDPTQLTYYAEFPITLVKNPADAELLICHHRAENDKIFDIFSEKLFAVERVGVTLAEAKSKKN